MSSNLSIKRICLFCGDEFYAKTTTTKYCSHKCNSRHYKQKLRDKKVEATSIPVEKHEKQIPTVSQVKEKDFLSIKDVCALIGISRSTLWRLEMNNTLVPTKFGNRKLYRRKDRRYV